MGRSESVVYASGKGERGGCAKTAFAHSPLKGRDYARRVSNVCPIALESEMSRNHRFCNKSFNKKAILARMGLRVSNVGRAVTDAEMSRNHRFFDSSFNRKVTRARMGLESLKYGPDCPGGGNEAKSSFL